MIGGVQEKLLDDMYVDKNGKERTKLEIVEYMLLNIDEINKNKNFISKDLVYEKTVIDYIENHYEERDEISEEIRALVEKHTTISDCGLDSYENPMADLISVASKNKEILKYTKHPRKNPSDIIYDHFEKDISELLTKIRDYSEDMFGYNSLKFEISKKRIPLIFTDVVSTGENNSSKIFIIKYKNHQDDVKVLDVNGFTEKEFFELISKTEEKANFKSWITQ